METRNKMLPWSFSSLTAFETCPRRYYLTRVTKEIIEPESEAILWGTLVHGAIEKRVKDGIPFPKDLAYLEKYVTKLLDKNGEIIVEKKLCIDSNFQPVDWFSPEAWCRGIVDIGLINGQSAIVLDWKTGKRKSESSQLHLFAALMFHHYPTLQKVVTGFVWLKDKKLDKESFTRDQLSELWSMFLPRVRRLEMAYESNKWLERPSALCARCPVGKNRCRFCGV